MHFSKSFSELLLSLPPELSTNAIEYRQLKKLINEIVQELASLGLNPELIQEYLSTTVEPAIQASDTDRASRADEGGFDQTPPCLPQAPLHATLLSKLVYEFSETPEGIEPRLRLRLRSPSFTSENQQAGEGPHVGLHGSSVSLDQIGSAIEDPQSAREFVVSLASDRAFFETLSNALQTLSAQLQVLHGSFISDLQNLSRTISLTARPAHSTTSFHALSMVTSDPSNIRIPSSVATIGRKSDLYIWREIFEIYVTAEVFEDISEAHRGERTVEDAEKRLTLFADRVVRRGLDSHFKFKHPQSQPALETFLKLNLFILNLKKFQFANGEARRKILKKHAKRTALPLPRSLAFPLTFPSAAARSSSDLVLIPNAVASLPRSLVQSIGETLLPIIPHIDDYQCLICTSIAFKPIRLFCGHLFCVRCLVKLQKRGEGNCPLCRAPTVLKANRANVDWALLNFMQDWFPAEAKEKLKQNEREAARESIQELGYDPDKCLIA